MVPFVGSQHCRTIPTVLLSFVRPVVIHGPLPVILDPASDECCDPMITNAISENEAVPVCQE